MESESCVPREWAIPYVAGDNFLLFTLKDKVLCYDICMQPNLAKIEQQAFHKAALQDGIIDILCGLCMIAWAVMIAFDAGGLGGISFAICFPSTLVLRKKLVEPRIGKVQLKKATLKGKQLLTLGVFSFTAIAGVVVSGFADSIPINSLGPLMLGLVFALVAAAIGFIYRARRGFFYTACITTVFLATRALELEVRRDDLLLPLTISGVIVLVTGAALLARFLSKHPILDNPIES